MLSKRLIELRKKKRITQMEISKKLGIARSTYAGYENGDRKPDSEMIIKLANYFGVSIDYLLCRTDDPTPPIEEKEKINIMDLKKALMEKELTWGGQKLKKEDQEVLRKIILAVLEREGFFKEKS
jgi:transcriptional regulator with XRE-family HTH domain